MTRAPHVNATDVFDTTPRVEPGQFDATQQMLGDLVPRAFRPEQVIEAYQIATTRRTLREMRYETPRLTAINVLYDIVTALRCPNRSE